MLTIDKNEMERLDSDFVVCTASGGWKPVNEVCACKLDSIYQDVENKKIKAFLRLLDSAKRGPVRPRRRVEKKHFQELSLITGGYYGK